MTNILLRHEAVSGSVCGFVNGLLCIIVWFICFCDPCIWFAHLCFCAISLSPQFRACFSVSPYSLVLPCLSSPLPVLLSVQVSQLSASAQHYRYISDSSFQHSLMHIVGLMPQSGLSPEILLGPLECFSQASAMSTFCFHFQIKLYFF